MENVQAKSTTAVWLMISVVLVALNNRWGAGPTILALVSAIVPYATVPAEIVLQRRGLLAGSWRLARPSLLFGGIAVAVVALYTVLLIVGPPGGSPAQA